MTANNKNPPILRVKAWGYIMKDGTLFNEAFGTKQQAQQFNYDRAKIVRVVVSYGEQDDK